MKRVAVIHAVLFVAVLTVVLAGCSSTQSASSGSSCLVTNEVTLAAHQAGEVAGAFESLGLELSMPLWFISGR